MIVIHVVRKPIAEANVAANVLTHGTGALNIDACRIATADVIETHSRSPEASKKENRPVYGEYGPMETHQTAGQKLGRWPANLILGHLPLCVPGACAAGCPVAALDEQTGVLKSGTGAVKRDTAAEHEGNRGAAYGAESRPEGTPMISYGDAGGASRYFKVVAHVHQVDR